jgi:acyl-ACP thioesterase
MTAENFKHIEALQVKMYECDFHGRWKPANFFRAIAEAAANHADKLGSGLQEMEAHGYYWVLSRLKIKFLRYPQQKEIVTIKTWPRMIAQKLFYLREFEILDKTENPLALATSAWLVIDTKSRRLVPPRRLQAMPMPSTPWGYALDEQLEKIVLPQGGVQCFSQKAAYSAIDQVGHVNNSRYVEAICDSFDYAVFDHYEIDWMQINYDKEVRPNSELVINMMESPDEANLFGFSGLNLTNQTKAFEAVVKLRPFAETA